MKSFPEKHLTVGGDDPFLPSLLQAINHADEVSITSAFIKQTGLRLIKNALLDAVERRVNVRILTGDYLGVTDPVALRNLMLLQEQGAEVKIFQSDGIHSFHMKAYLFTRAIGSTFEEGCAFIGSSNISQSALESGLEWNLKVDMKEDRNRFLQIMAEYEKIYNDPRCKNLTHQWIDDYILRYPAQNKAEPGEAGANEEESPPEPSELQLEALTALSRTREDGYRRGLVVMATGLGKTWLSAFDSQRINAKRILFVAHREEILNQAEETFVRIRPDAKVGRYAGNVRDLNVDMLFASIQTLGRSHHLDAFPQDYFDYVVVDEFHHAAARTYQQLLAHFSPRFLLGLTATPERTDQSDILAYCDDNLVFNKSLFDGIESKLLCPFHYYGVADNVDYREISWRNGQFDPDELVNQLATHARAKHNLKHWENYRQTRTLAFCISKKHADFMADFFSRNGVNAAAVHSDSELRRNDALRQLSTGEIDVIFSVDLFNEGVDLPSIDTVLMLRPTDSKIVFLQQLGRGLRQSEGTGKTKLVVLDFIGNHICYFRKPEALFNLGVTNKERKEFIDKVQDQSLTLPEGCFVNISLEAINFLEELVKGRIDRQLEIYRGLSESYGRRPTLAEFYRAGGAVDSVRREYGNWLNLVKAENDLSSEEEQCMLEFGGFLNELQTTQLVKSYKLILIESLIELDGFSKPISTLSLAKRSYEVLQRRRNLLTDLPEEYRSQGELAAPNIDQWHNYWKRNPINAWIGGNTSKRDSFFKVANDLFTANFTVRANLLDTFVLLVQEFVNYRFLQYEARQSNNEEVIAPFSLSNIETEERQDIPFFSDLRIACGHFKSSQHESENIEYHGLPLHYGKLDPAKHFIARAVGNSMNGGRNPIKDGDHLLLERITASNAGSNSGYTIAIERQDVTGDDQYLLRNINKVGDNQYQLQAQNPEYPPMMATEEMKPFARLKEVIKLTDIYLHQPIMREDIPPLFGMEFNTGLWTSGHVCPKSCVDQFLLVTLNKQGKKIEHQYHDYFKDQDNFHWQSQNNTAPEGSKGQAIINHVRNGSQIHLFVRKNKLETKKAAPFIYCGTVTYIHHTGSKPMNVDWQLNNPLTPALLSHFS